VSTEPPAQDRALAEEIERRIQAIEYGDETHYGAFTRLDWLLCIGGSLVFPYLLVWWFWP